MRKINKTLKNKRSRRNRRPRYSGGAEPVFSNRNALGKAYNELISGNVEDSILWLRDAMQENENNADAQSVIKNLLDKLNESKRLLDEVSDYLDKVVYQ